MELKEFIKASISAIVEAESELSQELADKGAVISPSSGYPIARDNYSGDALYFDFKDGRRGLVQVIEFNLSVTESNDLNARGGIGISVLKAGMQANSGSESVNSIRFSIPIGIHLDKP